MENCSLVVNFNKGDIVFYRGDAIQEQINWGSNDDPRTVLVEGQPYKIIEVDVIIMAY